MPVVVHADLGRGTMVSVDPQRVSAKRIFVFPFATDRSESFSKERE